jgi:hypothetical protein
MSGTLPWIAPELVAVLLLAVMIVLWFSMYRAGRASAVRGIEELGMIQDSVGILLALMIAFNFNLANSRYDARENLSVRHANAIGTSFLRCDTLLGTGVQQQCRSWLREYAAQEARVFRLTSLRELASIVARADAIQLKLWRAVIHDAAPELTLRQSLMLLSLNEMIALHNERTLVRVQFVPVFVVATTLILCLAWSAFCGYAYGLRGNPRATPWIAFACLVVLLVYVTFDIDRPGGLIQHVRGRTAMENLVERLKQSP